MDRKRLFNDLRVTDLRAELEKRNLDKTGVRGVLIQRLSKYLEEEGHDPATYRFDVSGSEGKGTPTKRARRTGSSTIEQEADETPAMEDMIVQDDAGEDEDDQTEPKDKPSAMSEPTSQDKMEAEESEVVNRKREINDATEAAEPKKTCLDKDDDHKQENNTDAEDSINLDIGDDELLNEETDSNTKSKKATVKKKEGEAERAALRERPALRLTHDTDVDEAGPEEPTPAPGSGAADGAAGGHSPADNHQVNADAAATSNDKDQADDEQRDDKDVDGDKKDKKDDGKEGGFRNLWVSGLSGDTRAKDLKQLCSEHGKVFGAKVVTNAKTPGSRCYGYVTMATSQDAENCIKNLHRTELHGRMISVERAKSESESSSSRSKGSRTDKQSSKDRKDDGKPEGSKEGDTGSEAKQKKESTASGPDGHRSGSRTREKSHRSDKDRVRRSSKSRERRRSPKEVLSFPKILKERDVARARERHRAAREDERRRRAAEDALRERERRTRQEKHRLVVEREKLRAERERIEREKNELLRLERERHRLEREKLEMERLELKRAQLRLEEERRKRSYESTSYRKPAASPPPEPAYDRDQRHKRVAPLPMSSNRNQFEAPPPPRFEMSSGYDRGNDKRDRDRDYKRDYPRHVASGNLKYPSNGNSNDDSRQPMPPGTRPKEPSRAYESRDSRPYRPSPPTKPDQRSWSTSTRYPDTSTQPKGNSGGEGWTSGESRYAGGSGGGYEPRYPPAYQPPPPGAAYPDRYAPPARDYRKY